MGQIIEESLPLVRHFSLYSAQIYAYNETMSTKKKRSHKKQIVYTIHWPVLLGLTFLLVAVVLLGVGVVRACALPEGDALEAEGTPEPIIQAPTWSPLPVNVDFTKVHSTHVKVFFPDEGKIRDMLLEEYILGVVAGEVGSSYPMEALKAQAVACRTYTMYSIRHGGCKTNPSADVCTSSSCCREVMLYNGKPINAMYHAASGGWTEDSEHVYGSTFSYLRSVESPHEIGSRQIGEVRYHRGTFVEKVNGARPNAHMEEDKLEEQLKVLSLYTSGRVEKLQLNEEVVTGRTARKLFGLDSAMFTVEITSDEVIFHTKGFGHGVGMSQAGANGMASDGADYKTILSHYYTGVSYGVIGQY